MLVRDPVKAEEFARRGVELVGGDMMDPPSLTAAIDGADSVITCAAGYTRHSPQDTTHTDTIGNRNLVDAAATVNVRRFVLTSILTCDKTPQVPHFWHKKLVEDRLADRGVRYVALPPAARGCHALGRQTRIISQITRIHARAVEPADGLPSLAITTKMQRRPNLIGAFDCPLT